MDYRQQDVRDIVRELLKHHQTNEALLDGDAGVDCEFEFGADRAMEILEHFANVKTNS